MINLNHGYLRVSGLWHDVHEMSLNDSSIYVVREGRRFLSNLLNDMPSAQEAEAEAVLGCILEPFICIPTSEDLPGDNVSFKLVHLQKYFFLIFFSSRKHLCFC